MAQPCPLPDLREASRVTSRALVGETGFEPAAARPPAGCATRLRHSPWWGDDSPDQWLCAVQWAFRAAVLRLLGRREAGRQARPGVPAVPKTRLDVLDHVLVLKAREPVEPR